ncbi:hypothetical protein GCM10026987_03820 [Belliella aquatica]|uniref:Uncharacterized protein n=1 Tax=Belliella aquatica TaxID=1323734 RepID=A0ABQ1MGB4_9BACT|nr:hypothetical protein GCM10010993_14760 [Belliella aquatica]
MMAIFDSLSGVSMIYFFLGHKELKESSPRNSAGQAEVRQAQRAPRFFSVGIEGLWELCDALFFFGEHKELQVTQRALRIYFFVDFEGFWELCDAYFYILI